MFWYVNFGERETGAKEIMSSGESIPIVSLFMSCKTSEGRGSSESHSVRRVLISNAIIILGEHFSQTSHSCRAGL